MIKIAYSTSNDPLLNALQVAISIILESMFFLLWFILWTTKLVYSSVMIWNIHAVPWLPNIHNHILITLLWCSVSRWGKEDIVHCVGWKGHHYRVYKLLPRSDSYLTKDARPKIVDAPWMFICRMGQGACRCCFHHSRWLIPHVWMSATNRHLDNPGCKANIIGAQLMHIFRMAQWPCHFLFCI